MPDYEPQLKSQNPGAQIGSAVRPEAYIGLFLVTLATLMYEILLTRIFSVTMWYHFAFVAISVAMFGMTVGSIIVYLCPRYFTQEQAVHHLGLSALCFSISVVICFLVYLNTPFMGSADRSTADTSLLTIALIYLLIATPFVFSGICVCLALTKFPMNISRLYAADLAGAAVGCIAVILVFRITDGPTAIVAAGLLAGVGALIFCIRGGRRLMRVALICVLCLAGFVTINTILAHKQSPLLRIIWAKGSKEVRPTYEKWNSFSRITVVGDPNVYSPPRCYGLSSTYPANNYFSQLNLFIDSTASTTLTEFAGDLDYLEFLRYDLTNFCHYLRPNADVLVVGTGGGRDILSALAFKQKSVTGVEINGDIMYVVNELLGEYTGHLDQRPDVTFVTDEARSYVARQKRRFDIIQVSFIDTWAATSAGALVLTENSLYTLEAWQDFLEHLTPGGVLTLSRWYFKEKPGELYRMITLATGSLSKLGAKNPKDHIVVVAKIVDNPTGCFENVGTILVSRDPFTSKDLDIVGQTAKKMRFQVVLSPRGATDPSFARLASGRDVHGFMADLGLDIAPPTDDRPFFFHMLRLRDALNAKASPTDATSFNMKAISLLVKLIFVVTGLTLACIIVPLLFTTKKGTVKGSLPLFIFFGGIGLGFMFVEISQMQRLIIFLGHPTYGLSVVLFTLLLSSGLGSYLTQGISEARFRTSAVIRMLSLLAALVIFGIATPHIAILFKASTTTIRILMSTGILFPLGVFMGMAFPLGMKAASTRFAVLTPWLWGINGAASVCASVFAAAIALEFGISATFWTGVSCYAAALIGLVWVIRGAVAYKETRKSSG